jgi:hypothetical protein
VAQLLMSPLAKPYVPPLHSAIVYLVKRLINGRASRITEVQGPKTDFGHHCTNCKCLGRYGRSRTVSEKRILIRDVGRSNPMKRSWTPQYQSGCNISRDRRRSRAVLPPRYSVQRSKSEERKVRRCQKTASCFSEIASFSH